MGLLFAELDIFAAKIIFVHQESYKHDADTKARGGLLMGLW